MKILAINKDVRFDNLVFDDVFRGLNYIAIEICWNTLPLQIRKELSKQLLEVELDYDDDWRYTCIVIPYINGILDFEHTYLYVNEYPMDRDEQQYAENYIKGKDTYLSICFTELSLSIYEKVTLLNKLLPSIDMTGNRKDGMYEIQNRRCSTH